MPKTSLQQSFVLVGQYIQNWAMLEFTIDGTIEEGLGLNAMQCCVILPNLSVRNKLDVLHVLISHSMMGEDDKKHYRKVVEHCSNQSKDRNTIVHSGFGMPEGETAVRLLKVQTTGGKLLFRKINWKKQDFVDRFDKLTTLTKELDALKVKLKQSKSYETLMQATDENQTNPFVQALKILPD